jgi:hypothetical protein
LIEVQGLGGNIIYKLGTSASTIEADGEIFRKTIILGRFDEVTSIQRGLKTLGLHAPESILLPLEFNHEQYSVNGQDLVKVVYTQRRIPIWINSSYITSQELHDLGCLILKQQSLLIQVGATMVDARPSNYSIYSGPRLVDLGSIKPLTKLNLSSFEADFFAYIICPIILELRLNIPVYKYFQSCMQDVNIYTSPLISPLRHTTLYLQSVKRNLIHYFSTLISQSTPEFLQYLIDDRLKDPPVAPAHATRKVSFISYQLTKAFSGSGKPSHWLGYSSFHDESYNCRKTDCVLRFLESLCSEDNVVDLGANVLNIDNPRIMAYIDNDHITCNYLRRQVNSRQIVMCIDIARELEQVLTCPRVSPLNIENVANSAVMMGIMHHIIIGRGLAVDHFYHSLSLLYENILIEYFDACDPCVKILSIQKSEPLLWEWSSHEAACSQYFNISGPLILSTTRRAYMLRRIIDS